MSLVSVLTRLPRSSTRALTFKYRLTLRAMSSLPPIENGDFSALPQKVQKFVEENAGICKPKNIHICDGSKAELDLLLDRLTKAGTIGPLAKHDNCYIARTDPKDVARVESKTFICTEKQHEAVPHVKEGVTGQLGRWKSLQEAEGIIGKLFPGCMNGRTMYVIPFSMGPIGSKVSKIGVELTDSPYVVCCMRIMTRMGQNVLSALGDAEFVRGLHSIGFPDDGTKQPEVPYWPCNPEQTIITHFPKTREIKSFGSGYGGNSLLGKKCFALRIAGVIARDEGWLAEHMMIMGLTNPKGEKKYIAAAFPSACGKTNLAMLQPTIPGWTVECVGDDIAWMWFDETGQLRAINPESGFFGVAPGTSFLTNPNAMKTFQKDTIFTNIAETSDGDFWWEGLDPPKEGVKIKTWLNEENWDPASGRKAAHPNSRFCAPSDHCPIMDKDWESPAGVPISAILFGGRRPQGVPLIYQSFNWQHGVFVASALSSEATAAAEFKGKQIMRDPFAMRPFMGYNFGKYLEHWLEMERPPHKLPQIFHVNWFRLDKDGNFLWPGFGENSRVLEWVFNRTNNEDIAEASPIGFLPKKGTINTSGLKEFDNPGQWEELFSIPKDYWLEEIQNLRNYFGEQVGEDLPKRIAGEIDALEQRLKASN